MSASVPEIRVEELLRLEESYRERLAASLRLVIFAALFFAAISVSREGQHHLPLLAATLAYGVLAVAGVWFAWRKMYHAALPLVFLTIEVVLVALQALLFGSASEEPGAMIPAAGLVFILLAHASMRPRPWLVLYVAGLFLWVLWLGQQFDGSQPSLVGTRTQHEHEFAHYQLIPTITLILTAIVLYSNNRRTRRVLEDAVHGRASVARLSRFFAPAVATRLAAAPEAQIAEGQRMSVAVLFTDIRGFSGMVESMSPEDVGHLLGEFRSILASVVLEHNGVVDKFIGDAVMAVFGFPQSGSHAAADALACATAIMERVAKWEANRTGETKAPLEIGIGAHFGEAFVGIVGKEYLLEFTVIGDTVNVAERLERLTRTLDATIAVSGTFYREARAEEGSQSWLISERHPIPGRQQPVDIYYLPRSTGTVQSEASELSLSGQPT